MAKVGSDEEATKGRAHAHKLAGPRLRADGQSLPLFVSPQPSLVFVLQQLVYCHRANIFCSDLVSRVEVDMQADLHFNL
jgi:hypothetical protein